MEEGVNKEDDENDKDNGFDNDHAKAKYAFFKGIDFFFAS